ncbi:hypothetical protein MNBD_ALPHA07-641 [hydrothermal vent metagenome]|uniref:SH3b domain-containing protein n=1 Tax=hydrothermal vent metagenome TaxID=652676 RepID=A0A3B0RUC1_9ZZZZ
MKLFILITFTFLGWAFYVISGGADYAPRPGTLQARVVEEKTPPVRGLNDSAIHEDESTTASLADIDVSKGDGTQITLASVGKVGDDELAETAKTIEDTGTDLEKVAVLTLDTLDEDVAVVESVIVPETTQPGDIREVAGKVVNMRGGPGTSFERVGALTKGTEIEVLEDPGNGWIRLLVLETGEMGWIADWLVTAAN